MGSNKFNIGDRVLVNKYNKHMFGRVVRTYGSIALVEYEKPVDDMPSGYYFDEKIILVTELVEVMYK